VANKVLSLYYGALKRMRNISLISQNLADYSVSEHLQNIAMLSSSTIADDFMGTSQMTILNEKAMDEWVSELQPPESAEDIGFRRTAALSLMQ